MPRHRAQPRHDEGGGHAGHADRRARRTRLTGDDADAGATGPTPTGGSWALQSNWPAQSSWPEIAWLTVAGTTPEDVNSRGPAGGKSRVLHAGTAAGQTRSWSRSADQAAVHQRRPTTARG